MKQVIAAGVSGLIFGIGLTLSGMSNPSKVLNFLDVAGTWDPSLVFVLGGAIIVTAVGYAILRGRASPMFAAAFRWPTRNDIDRNLLGGAATFGLGWGLVGFCPGPAFTALFFSTSGALIFVPAMLVGMLGARWLQERRTDYSAA